MLAQPTQDAFLLHPSLKMPQPFPLMNAGFAGEEQAGQWKVPLQWRLIILWRALGPGPTDMQKLREAGRLRRAKGINGRDWSRKIHRPGNQVALNYLDCLAPSVERDSNQLNCSNIQRDSGKAEMAGCGHYQRKWEDFLTVGLLQTLIKDNRKRRKKKKNTVKWGNRKHCMLREISNLC